MRITIDEGFNVVLDYIDLANLMRYFSAGFFCDRKNFLCSATELQEFWAACTLEERADVMDAENEAYHAAFKKEQEDLNKTIEAEDKAWMEMHGDQIFESGSSESIHDISTPSLKAVAKKLIEEGAV